MFKTNTGEICDIYGAKVHYSNAKIFKGDIITLEIDSQNLRF